MRLPWKRDAKLIEPRWPVCTKVLELETAKEILAEVLHTKTTEVDLMIQRRLEERDWCEEGLWPATFCLGD